MDFASLMAKEISKAKPSDAPKDKDNQTSSSSSKYMRRADVEAARVAAYKAEQEALERQREEKAALKRKHEEEEAERRRDREEKKRKLAEESKKKREAEEEAAERQRRKKLGLPELPPQQQQQQRSSEEGTPVPEGEDISEEDLIAKLREMAEPAILFGETHKARLKRYRRLVQRSLTPQLSKGPIPTTLELVPEKDMKIPAKAPKPSDQEARAFLFRQLASYFTMVLEEWEIALAKRDISVKESFAGRQAYNAMVQSRENMRPLFKKFEGGDIDETVLEAIVEIVHCAQERRYVDANDGYLRLSIGKAAWPIGVTMVGIHERSAREKLHESDNKAHIMSDESTRKYLQSIKRCLSFAQVRWPPDDQLQLMG
ncbi:hypothetical protein UA08_03228 [Talaromyces atroroseus]|uniref:Pre-mRNA-splicing factor 18 n=1 Tax=Talaromyces atroroseus TaxID=1441469 RepID=A0A225AHI4_TALAT|nr:hypothetical protein UA08_03228 [Talaromyces atroroseus]OKL60892.1 hypothetical protein UA08_03228 [Talaromyces atroroseus]